MTTSGEQSVLSKQLLQEYRRDGFLLLRSVLSASEVSELRRDAERLLERADLIDPRNIRCRWKSRIDKGPSCFEGFDPVVDISPAVERIARDERITGPLSSLYGDQASLVMDKLIYKAPGSVGYRLHQDYISWPSFPETYSTFIIAIDAACALNGATEVFPGYHERGYMSPRDGRYHELNQDQVDTSKGVLLNLEPGDGAIFSGFTPHRSAPNRSAHWRRLIYLSYKSAAEVGGGRDAIYGSYHTRLSKILSESGRSGVFFR